MASEPVPAGSPADGAAGSTEAAAAGLSLKSAAGKWVVAATVLGSAIVFIDATVVNVALPAIGRDFNTGIAALQWTITAYALTLSAFLLVGGSLGDRHGRRRVFVIGVVWFALASALCGLAPWFGVLIAARALQGIGAAMLVPGSLAILQATFRREDRAPAIGLWSGLSGVATAVGPFLGGYFIQAVSWRLIFLVNLPLVVAVVWIALRHVPETRDDSVVGRLDIWGAALAAIGLGSLVFGVIEGPALGWSSPLVVAAFVAVAVTLPAFLALESRREHPMLPLKIFRSRQFAGANAATLLIYAGLYGTLFLIPVQLQQVLGYSPLEAGVALLPITGVMLLLSPWAGRLSQRVGPRLPMTIGPLTAAVGLFLLSQIQDGSGYVTAFLPAVLVFSLGLALTVSPLTAAVLAAAPAKQAGLASAINNTAARAAGVIAVAALPVAAGLTGSAYLEPARFSVGYEHAMWLAALLCALGGVTSFATMESVCVLRKLAGFSCPLDAPPLVADQTQRG